MPQRSNLKHMLHQTRDLLRGIRRAVVTAGHIEAMQCIDSLVGFAEEETARQLRRMEPDINVQHANRAGADVVSTLIEATTTNRDRRRVAVEEVYEVRLFAQDAGISVKQTKDLIERHGNDRQVLNEKAEQLLKQAGIAPPIRVPLSLPIVAVLAAEPCRRQPL